MVQGVPRNMEILKDAAGVPKNPIASDYAELWPLLMNALQAR
jgi:hypothetical protein